MSIAVYSWVLAHPAAYRNALSVARWLLRALAHKVARGSLPLRSRIFWLRVLHLIAGIIALASCIA
mgnify:CR=1 FL=1